MDRLTLYFDGGSRPNPDRMEIAVVSGGRTYIRDDLGPGDNCTAEWLALLYAVEIAVAAGAADAVFVGDARTIVEQALGRWRCRSPQLQPHLAAYRIATAGFARVHVRHVGRSKNLAGTAPAAKITSLWAVTLTSAPFRRSVTPVQRPACRVTFSTWARVCTVRLWRLRAGFRYPSTTLQRWPPFCDTW